MSLKTNGFYQFGEFRFDSSKRLLWRGGEMVALTPKAAEVLDLLLDRRGDLVERQEIIDSVWSDTFVEEGNLNHAISALRRVLGAEMIQTVPRRGYRFAAEVTGARGLIPPDVVIERHSVTNTVVEESEIIDDDEPALTSAVMISRPASITGQFSKTKLALLSGVLFLAASFGIWFLIGSSAAATNAARRSVRTLAVLPLRSFADNNGDEELRLRITDALITKLGTFEDLAVRPTASILRFRNELAQDPLEAGKTLKVDAVIDGRVQEENGRLRVTLQMLSVPGGEQLWSRQFDGRVGETLALQDAIAVQFVNDFGARPAQPSNRPAYNSESYEAYLKGRYLWNQRRRESYYKALEYFQRSVELDPRFALGYSGIADCYHLMEQRNDLPTREAMDKAEAMVRKALELEPDLAEANTSMGNVMFIKYSRWGEAEKYYRHAIDLNPNLAEPYARLGMLYNAWGRFDDGSVVLSKAIELDPTSLNNAIYMGMNLTFSRQYDRAEEHFKHILEFAPNTERAHWFLERIYEMTGRYEEAAEQGLKERQLLRPETVEPLRKAYQDGGIRGFWRKQIELLSEESKTMYGLDLRIAMRYIMLGDKERACDHIEKNLNDLGSMRNYGRSDPFFDSMRSYPRFKKLMDDSTPIY